ncbi:hypothetical protein POLUDNITSA_00330 [Brevundimonas phage vB_BpoS-Poludnitsa]|nr:hypothetical protein POLUDNITSA_00330 [Brevundimonas phage vB_BpoS-Poludnitsa]
MGYQTGTLDGTANLTTLVGLITAFAATQGWTVNGNYLSNGDCHATLHTLTTGTMNDTYGPSGSAAAPDHILVGRLNAVNAPMTSAQVIGSAGVRTNDLTPPYANYWLFSGGVGDPPYIHLVVQKASGRFCHFSFGVLDKKGVPYSGGAFMIGERYNWGFSSSSPNSNASGSNIDGTGHYYFGSSGSYNQSTYNISMGEIEPGVVIADGPPVSDFPNGILAALFDVGDSFPASIGNARWLGTFFHLGPLPINGVTPLMEVPVLRYSTNARVQYFGSLPNWRYCSMIGRDEGETVSFAGEEWMIFPIKRARPWNPEPYAEKIVTSGPYGFAVKKVI